MAKKETRNLLSYRALAKILHRSPSHIYRVMNGERESAKLLCEMKRMKTRGKIVGGVELLEVLRRVKAKKGGK
jgi:transposase